MYYPLQTAVKKLNISESDLLTYRATGDIRYFRDKDKYDIHSILETATMVIGLEKLLSDDMIKEIDKLMEDFSKLKFTIFSGPQKGVEYKDSGANRPHLPWQKRLTRNSPPSYVTAINGDGFGGGG